ncbi:hypothetical protein HK097_008470 [Rhizophlyctis rosea]|uniref:Bax inhibitor 1 n=1 Tax=Rhizophlyctis rosea TaxID=64517 RepID=A0AAD5X9G4_9FUNG|nr:hypothetical protein HK097_008470 [Rhizophlyctis rosea]
MDTFSSYFAAPPASAYRWDNLKQSVSPSVRTHLQNVYTNLAVMLSISAAGAYLDMTRMLPVLRGGSFSLFTTFASLLAFAFTPPTPQNHITRKYLLYAFALSKGLSLGPLIQSTMYINPSNVFIALLSAALLFGSFSASALLTPRRDALYIGGLLSSAVTIMMGMSIVNLFLRNSSLFSAELYLGLLVFAGYVIFDTQVILAKAELGNRDYLAHSMELYVDLVAIFVRILIILQKKEADKERERRKKNEKRR